jgi:Mn-dependent DtxR family transcriptional regulator
VEKGNWAAKREEKYLWTLFLLSKNAAKREEKYLWTLFLLSKNAIISDNPFKYI